MSEVPKGSMRAFALSDFEAPASIRDLPMPDVGPGEVLVKVHAASINSFDAAVARGWVKDFMEYRFPVIVGKDFAGVVERTGEGVTRFDVGDQVLGILPPSMVLDKGSFAEYVAVPAEGFIATKPASLDFNQAAALGLAAAGAQAAVEAVHPSDGDRILIVGATGGVGSYAVQLAAGLGATVIATSHAEDEASMRELGASETVEYTGDVARAMRASGTPTASRG